MVDFMRSLAICSTTRFRSKHERNATWYAQSHPANQLHEGVDLVRNSRPVGTEILFQANSAKERDDQARERIIIVTDSTRCSEILDEDRKSVV